MENHVKYHWGKNKISQGELHKTLSWRAETAPFVLAT